MSAADLREHLIYTCAVGRIAPIMILGRFHHQQGIALGPILFIVAILALLAVAIAAGSGGFNANTNTESANAMAEVIVNYEDSVYQTVQMLLANGCTATQISFSNPISTGVNGGVDPYANPNAPSDYSCNVFDPRGGRLTYMLPPPAALNPSMSANPGYGYYYFTGALAVENMGNWSANTPDLIMSVPYVSSAVGTEINSFAGLQTNWGNDGNQLCDIGYQKTYYFKGTYSMPCSNASGSYDMYYAPNVIGSPQGCVWRSDSAHTNGVISTYILDCYHVLIVQ